jgi:dienelactone hydrolase
MTPAIRPLRIGAADRELFAVAYVPPPRNALRGGVLICPPFFHEHFLGYRLISLVAARLAAQGWLCLRFDYFGSGDSAGDEQAFTLRGASADARTALRELRGLVGAGRPVLAMGVRAGVWPALAAMDADVARACLWQPPPSGAAWLEQLEAMDAHERASRQRYPHLRGAARAAAADRLLGSCVDAALRAELAAERGGEPPHAIPFDVVAQAQEPHGAGRFIELPPALAGWETELTIRNVFPGRELGTVIERLTAAWPGSAAA